MPKSLAKRLASLLLILAMVMALMPSAAAAESDAVSSNTAGEITTVSEESSTTVLPVEAAVPDIIGIEEAEARGHVKRLRDEEGNDLNKLVFENADGTKTMYLYDFPVKYVDEQGDIHDISLDIADTQDARQPFRTASGGAVTTFSAELSDGITLTNSSTSLRLVPRVSDGGQRQARRLDEKTVEYPYADHTTIEYSLTYTGFKEDIVVSQYTGQTEYPFTLYTGGLTLTQIDGSYYLTDADGAVQATVGDIIIFTADERNNTFGQLRAETVVPNEEYLLTIVLDPEYLSDPNTLYPIRIDPTVEVNYDSYGSTAIEDVTINSTAGSSFTSGSLFVGLREDEGISRVLMRFPGLDLTELADAEITSATVELRDLLCESKEQVIECYVYTGTQWTDSSTWATLTQTFGPQLDSVTMGYEIGYDLDPRHRYSFDITDAVQGWVDGTYTQSKGIIFKSVSTLEGGTTYQYRTLASYNRSSNKPSLTVVYTNGIDGDSSVNVGSTMQLTTDMEGTITWTSSNLNLATVSSTGLVTALHPGWVSVTATTTADGYTPQTFSFWVTVPNGVYRIRNQLSGRYLDLVESNVLSNTDAILQDIRSSAPQCLSQSWKITYLGDGYYTIRPMHALTKALEVIGTGVNIWAAGASDNISNVPSYCRWTIEYVSGGYIFKHGGSETKAMFPYGLSTAAGTAILVGSYTTSSPAYRWSLESVEIDNQIVIYDTNAQAFASDAVRYIAPGESLTLSELGLNASFVSPTTNYQNIVWSSNSSAVSVDVSTGQITGVTPNGSATITAKRTYYGVAYSQSYTVHVAPIADGTYFITNREYGRYIQIDDDVSATTSGAIMELFTFDGAEEQRWEFTLLDSGYYSIISSSSGLALSVASNKTASTDVSLIQEAYTGAERQQWLITQTDDGYYKIKAHSALDLSTDLAMAAGYSLSGDSDGLNVEQRVYSDDSNYIDEWILAYICYTSPVECEGQSKSNWCWATSARMFAKHYYPTVSYTQDQAVEHVMGSQVNASGTIDQATSAIQYYISNISEASLDLFSTEGYVYSEDTLVEFLDDGNVVYIGRMLLSNSGLPSGHATLIYGYVIINSEYRFLIRDPLPANEGSTYLMSYSKLYNGQDCQDDESPDNGFWCASIVVNTSYAQDVEPYFFG